MRVVFALAAVAIFSGCDGHGVSEAHDMASATEEEVEQLKGQVSDAETEIEDLESRIDTLELEIATLRDELSGLESRVSTVEIMAPM